jgi:DNA-binding transcriptional regulator YhcF (GntR family)
VYDGKTLMIKWRIDKDNKIPLYLQLKDLIKYYISTGVIQDDQQLPGVNALGKELNVNFETVRKAYKELEKEGLLKMARGRGTYVTLHPTKIPRMSADPPPETKPEEALKLWMKRLVRSGIGLAEVKKTVARIINDIEKEESKQIVIFTECNHYQVKEISKTLRSALNLNVRAVLVENLKKEVDKILKGPHNLLAVITTGFHINEVRRLLEDIPVSTHVLITSMSNETRQALLDFDRNKHFGFICRDRESIPLWEDLIKDELGKDIDLRCSILADRDEVQEILQSVNVVMVSPPVYKEIKKQASPKLSVFNVFDKVDSMSMRLIKDRLTEHL